eukprot:g36365.t1
MRGLEGILEAFPLSTCGLPAISELGVEHLLGESCVSHVDNMPCPAQLIKGGQCIDAGDVGLIEDTDVGASVLPADSQDLVQAAM